MAAALALLWPAHGLGVLDGIPLDGRVEAVLVGVLFPVLWWFHPGFLQRSATRATIALLCVLKLADATMLGQQGWCGRFTTSAPLFEDALTLQHSWDARADWFRAVPRCSMIVSRPYPSLESFPIWFLNMPVNAGRPPNAAVRMAIDGYLSPRAAGTLAIQLQGAESIRGTIADRPIDLHSPSMVTVPVPAGPARIDLELLMTGGHWAFEPRWNGRDVFDAVPTSVDPPRPIDAILRPLFWAAWSFVPLAFLAAWLAAAAAATRPPLALAAWAIGFSAICWAAAEIHFAYYGRLMVLPFVAAAFVPVPTRLRSMRGAFLLVGLPWLALFVGGYADQIGAVTFYTVGDDWLQFQRYAYRIFMQGFWLEGGQKTFWFQPLYRWMVGGLHVLFGDSSVGEIYLDAASLLTGAMLAYYVTKRTVGFRWGIIAASMSLATVVLGPTWYIVGRGLSEIVSAGFLYLAAFCVLRGPVDGAAGRSVRRARVLQPAE
jgi:hypothetical protein